MVVGAGVARYWYILQFSAPTTLNRNTLGGIDILLLLCVCQVGDKVGVGCIVDSCLACEACKGGDEHSCDNGKRELGLGLNRLVVGSGSEWRIRIHGSGFSAPNLDPCLPVSGRQNISRHKTSTGTGKCRLYMIAILLLPVWIESASGMNWIFTAWI